jgi:two-component system, OmpR family, phosphate regulon sensor histidine kinase PhoR
MIKSIGVIAAICLMALGFSFWGSDTLAARFLAVSFVVYALANLFHKNALHNWAALREKRELPQGLGYWGSIFNRLRKVSRSDAESRQTLRIEFDRIQAVVDQLPDGLVVLDQYDHIIWYNNAARSLHEIFGFTRPIHHFIRQPEFFTYLADPAPLAPIKVNLATRPGRLFELRVITAHDSQKLLITRDVTDASKIDVMRRDFVANVSHEIRTPVTVIGGFAETLLEIDLDKETQKTYLDTIVKQSQTMKRLLEDLLILSSLDSGKDVAARDEVDMYVLLEALMSEAKSLSQNRHKLTAVIDGPKVVLGAQTEIETAARNLIVNALRYTPEGGSVEVSWHAQNPFANTPQAWFRVKDTGPGIAKEHLPRLTERFYRVDSARSRDTGGTGLGLAIVKHIAQRHQAELVIESELGKGSQFAIGFYQSRLINQG